MTANGAILIDKASDWTSHDVVAKLRGIVRERRIGHAGTLDPMATGLLVVAVGPSTRLLRFAQAGMKTYTGRVRFGVATDSLDATGTVVAQAPVPTLTLDLVQAAATSFIGDQLQVPPMVSAIKVGGQKLYDLARAGHEVERAPRPITIRSFEVAATSDPVEWDFTVVTSPGTYVRVLAADLAELLGTLGHLTVLRRTASGRSDVTAALTLDEVAQRVRDGVHVLAPPTSLVAHLAQVVLNEQDVIAIRHGKTVASSGEGEVALLDGAGQLVAIAEATAGKVKPVVVLPAEGASGQG